MAMGKVLVADDDKNICELLRLYLVKEGFQATARRRLPVFQQKTPTLSFWM